MKVPPTLIFLVFLILISFTACEKNSDEVTGVVEIYLLEEFETVGEGAGIDAASAVTKPKPLVKYDDLRKYNAEEYFFKVTDDARETIENMPQSVFGIAFAVTADDELIYTGYFVPLYSSASVQWIVIDPLFWRLDNRMYVELGYPGLIEGSVIPDHRNDPRILDIFRRDGKLVE